MTPARTGSAGIYPADYVGERDDPRAYGECRYFDTFETEVQG